MRIIVRQFDNAILRRYELPDEEAIRHETYYRGHAIYCGHGYAEHLTLAPGTQTTEWARAWKSVLDEHGISPLDCASEAYAVGFIAYAASCHSVKGVTIEIE